MAESNDFLSSLKNALPESVCQKFQDHQIDGDLFKVVNVDFMRDVLQLSVYDIMKVKTFQAKYKAQFPSDTPIADHFFPLGSDDDDDKTEENSLNPPTSPHLKRKRKLRDDDATHSKSKNIQRSGSPSNTNAQPIPSPQNSKQNSPKSSTKTATQKGHLSKDRSKKIKAPLSSQNSTKDSSQSESSSENQESHPRNDNEFSDSDKENSGGESSRGDIVTLKDLEAAVKAFTPDPEPSFASLKQSLPKFDVIKILHDEMKKAHCKFKASFVELLKTKHLDRTKRLVIIRKLTNYLYVQHASTPLEVTPSMKEGMAKSFCILFPRFANLEDKHQPWSTLFSPVGPSGFIANASRALMRKYPKRPAEKTRKRKAQPTDCEMDEADIEALGIMDSGRHEKSEILNGMAQCFAVREAERANGESVTFFMKKYPQFNKYGGEVLSEEFHRLRPQAEDMCKMFLRLLPNILSLNFRREVNLPIEDEGIKAMLILSQHLPHDIPRRKEKTTHSWAELKDILVVLKPSESVEGYVVERIDKAKTPIQPYLIIVRGQVEKNRIMKIFIVLDAELCAVESVSSVKAIDWLFKCYFIFNVDYPFGWRNTFHLLQTCFYKILEHQGSKKDKVTSSEFELFSKIRS